MEPVLNYDYYMAIAGDWHALAGAIRK
jgi:hypothetical protein